MMTHSKTYWALIVLPILAFLAASYLKLTGSAMEVQAFAMFGYSMTFMYIVGVLELLGALGLLFGHLIHGQLPRLAALGLLLLLGGILYTHATHPPLLAGIPAVILTVLLIVFLQKTRGKISTSTNQTPE